MSSAVEQQSNNLLSKEPKYSVIQENDDIVTASEPAMTHDIINDTTTSTVVIDTTNDVAQITYSPNENDGSATIGTQNDNGNQQAATNDGGDSQKEKLLSWRL